MRALERVEDVEDVSEITSPDLERRMSVDSAARHFSVSRRFLFDLMADGSLEWQSLGPHGRSLKLADVVRALGEWIERPAESE